MMNIAFVVPYVPNKIRTRPYNLIRYLSKAGHTVTVFTVGANVRDEKDVITLQAECSRVYFRNLPLIRSGLNCLVALLTQSPLQAVYSWDVKLAEQLRLIIEGVSPGYDIVHVEHLRGSKYGRYIIANNSKIPVVWDSVDCISNLFEQAGRNGGTLFGKIITRFELGRTRSAEAELIRCFDHVLTTSASDRDALLALPSTGGEPSPISVLTGGVDLDYFYPNPEILSEPDTLVFSGKMSYHANIAMVKYLVNEIMPLVWQKRPQVRLIIVGKDPSRAIVEFAKNPLIEVTGTVDDIRPFLWKAAIAVVPLVYGAGIQNKIIEAMACGTPVVTTSRTLSALNVHPDRDLLVGDDPVSFAAQIVRLLSNPDQRITVRDAGLRYVKAHHDWRQIAGQLVDLYKQVVVVKHRKMSLS